MPQLNTEFFLSQIFWLALIFAALYFFVSKFFVPRIGTVVDKRESSIKRFLEESESIVAKQKAINAKIQDLLDKSRLEAAELRRSVSKETELSLSKDIAKVEREMQKKILATEEKLLNFKRQTILELKHSVDTVSNEVLAKILKIAQSKRKSTN